MYMFDLLDRLEEKYGDKPIIINLEDIKDEKQKT